jgi:uncharacterized membrane protein YeaQ/YmgE (transglycosylase-associated protein family)
MSLFPFLILGLLNGIMVGIGAGLVARAIAPGEHAVRFRDAALLGMLGSIAGNGVATLINSQDGYLASGPSSLLFSVVGASLAIGAVSYTHLARGDNGPSRSYDSNRS